MRWIQIRLDNTIRRLSAKWTRLSALASIAMLRRIPRAIIDTDWMIQTRWDDTVGCLVAICAWLSALASEAFTNSVIQTRRDCTDRVRVSVCFYTWLSNWNDAAVGWSCLRCTSRAAAVVGGVALVCSSGCSEILIVFVQRTSCQDKKKTLLYNGSAIVYILIIFVSIDGHHFAICVI